MDSKEKSFDNLKKDKKVFLIIGILVLLALIYFLFFYSKTCNTKECFEENLKECNRAKFINSANITLEYLIKGSSNDLCEVQVTFLQGDVSNQDFLRLKNKEMSCYLVKGLVISPESSLDNCHGELKEQLQELIISKLHKYIVQNLGKLNADLLGFK